MAGEEPEVRRKHRRSSDDGVEGEGSKRRKHHHRHHRHHHHRHRSSKHEEQNLKISSHLDEISPIVESNLAVNLNLRADDDDKEEGEILDEEVYGDMVKKKEESDVESGEIEPAEVEHRNPRIYDEGEKDKEMCDEADIVKSSRAGHIGPSDKDYETGETDTESVMLRERQHRDKTSRRANGDVGEKSRKGDLKTQRGSESPLERAERESSHRDMWASHGRSRSPVYEEDVDLRKHGKVDDKDAEELDLARHVSRRHSEPGDFERNRFENRRKSVSPESKDGKYVTVVHSPRQDRYRESDNGSKRSRSRDHVRERRSQSRDHARERRSRSRDHVRERSSRSRDHARERRSQSRSYLQDSGVYSYTESRDQVNHSGSREKARNENDHQRAVRKDRDDRHGSRDWVRDREREWSSSYSRNGRREDMHSSWDPRQRERDRESHKNRVGDRDSDRDITNDRNMGRARDRNREREREELDLDWNRDSRRSQQSKPGHYADKSSKHQLKASSYTYEEMEERGNKLKGDEAEQGDYEEKVELKLAAQEEDDIARIKEESRKRREAILEKYRCQHQDKQGEHHSEDSEIEDKDSLTVDKPTDQVYPEKVLVNSAPHGLVSRNNGLDQYNADPNSMFSVGKSPLQNGPVAYERALGTGGLGDGTPKSERSEDMFCDDIFGESPTGVRKTGKGEGVQVERNGLNDNWDDAEGYYSYRFGEVLDGRYEVTAAHGKGVFSTVVRAKDLKAGKGEPEEVAIKIIRNNDTMYKAGLEELVILKKLADADPEDRRRCVRFISSFKYRNHLCLVFESLHMNLREVLKKFGRNIGLKLDAVRAYAKQLFVALKHLRNCGVLHCDIKPDNMLVNEAKNVLKLCDFGNAMFAGKNEITPYLVSRFYRAPEIILGLTYDHPMDIWSVGCCMYELYSGKVLFPGPSNNDMLRLHMELKGPFPKKMLRKGSFTDKHFDNDLNFCATEEDPVSKKSVKRLLLNIKPRDISAIITGSAGEDPKMLANFKDLLEKVFVLDPEKRMTVSQALNHPFITGK